LRSFTGKHSIVLMWAMGLLFCAGQTAAQSTGTSGTPPKEEKKEERGITLYEAFEGSTNTDGQVMDLNTTAGYIFNRHFSWDAGLPVFFFNGTTSTGTKTTSNGIGDAYTDFRLTFNNPAFHYVIALSGSVPTGDSSKGRSTGRATVNWGNSFSREFNKWTPFANINVGNSLYNTGYFRRPFLTLGKVATFEAGTAYDLGHSFSVSASAYDVAPWARKKYSAESSVDPVWEVPEVQEDRCVTGAFLKLRRRPPAGLRSCVTTDSMGPWISIRLRWLISRWLIAVAFTTS